MSFAPIRKFFGNRMPIADEITLTQRSTYILPTKAGLFLFAIILLMLIGATNYQNNLAFMLTFLTASIGMVSILVTYKNLQGLLFKMAQSESVCAGEKTHLSILIESLEQQTHSALAIGTSKNDLIYFDVVSQYKNRVELAIQTDKRGRMPIPRLIVCSQFPFGLLNAWSWFKFESTILVYPTPIEPPVESGVSQTSDEEYSSFSKGQDELYGLKNYQQGEPLSRIDWKAVAREKGIFSREFVDYQNQDTVFDWNDYAAYPNESILSFLCFLVLKASRENTEFGLNLPNRKIAFGQGKQHVKKCLEALAIFGSD
jgi:uncharacterized protein (DUF58 family)